MMALPTESDESAEFLERLRAALERLPLPGAVPRYAVAFSGGVDSTVLLTAMVRIAGTERVAAFHIDHGLHAESQLWALQCERAADALGVAFRTARVAVPSGSEHGGPEAAARTARYEALRELMRPGDVLLTAHHGDDQLETLLLRLLRGSGVRGLTGIHELAAFGPGLLARPMLEFTRAEVTAQALRWNLNWIDDPANAALRFDRSYLRARVLPALHERWPSAQRAAARLTRQMAEAEQMLEEIAADDARDVADLHRLPCAHVRGLKLGRQSNLLRCVIRTLDLPMPSSAHLEHLREAIVREHPDGRAQVTWPGVVAHIYREHVYLLPTQARLPGRHLVGELAVGREWQGLSGSLRLVPADAGFPDDWARSGIEVRFRSGGERFRPANHRHSKTLKHWFQENGVLPWMRDRIPLLFRRETLIGVADLWISDEAQTAASQGPKWRAEWSGHPPVL
jgi:tRNA(Ile)-lysidine synthase